MKKKGFFMLVKVKSIANRGIQTFGVDVEVNISNRGIPGLEIVGLGDKSIAESRDRVKTAFQNSGLQFPNKKITINLAPADLNKEGSFYDLPIAVGLICALLEVPVPDSSLFFGELSFDGSLRHTKGSFLLSLYAKENNFQNVFVPSPCAREAGSVEGLSVYSVTSLSSLIDHLTRKKFIEKYNDRNIEKDRYTDSGVCEYDYVIGQEQAKRALQICAAGGHNLIMIGPPGSGKTMIAKSISSIIPDLSQEESVEVTKIYSLVGKIPPNFGLLKKRPFRSPHHTISYAGMVGGGNNPVPGEITLAHRGVLFMDEFSEFSRQVIESLRQPLENGKITVSRSRFSVEFPSRFILMASSNPCPCGFYGDPNHQCTCTENKIKNYRAKLSGPILDRIDIHVNVLPVEKKLLIKDSFSSSNETLDFIKKKVANVRFIQQKRFKDEKIFTNSEIPNSQIDKFCSFGKGSKRLLEQAIESYRLSARAYFKVIRVARTIADLDEKNDIELNHIAEAVQYRSKFIL